MEKIFTLKNKGFLEKPDDKRSKEKTTTER